jgi:hypothetical protein
LVYIASSVHVLPWNASLLVNVTRRGPKKTGVGGAET